MNMGMVVQAGTAHLVLSPATAAITAGGHQAYTAHLIDGFGNDLGDVTASTLFTIGPNGLCALAVCTATAAGPHTVTGSNGIASGTASLTVNAGPLAHLGLTPSSSSITAGGHQAYTAEGFDHSGNHLGDVTASTTFGIAPDGSCSGATCTAAAAGPHTITGTDGIASGTASLTVNAGPLDHLTLTPPSSTVTAGGSQTYRAEGFDASGNDLGDLTASTVFTIAPDGVCTLASCTASHAGAHTITGTDGAATGTSALTVTAGGLDHLALSPATANVPVGGHRTYTAEGLDHYGNDLGDVTASTTFTVTPFGSCTGATCTVTSVGSHTVIGTDGAASGTATLGAQVLDHLVLSPASASIAAGGHQAYTAEGFDASNTDLGDVTAGTSFSIGPNGSCTGASCTATIAGTHTVTGHDGGKAGTASLTVTAAPVDHLVLSPASASVTAGGHQAYTAEGFDVFNNDIGDVSSSTTFGIGPNGTCAAATCTATAAGAHTVTGTDGAATGTATLTVNPGPLDHLGLSPATSTITAGGQQSYSAEGFDHYNNDLGSVTVATTFGIDDPNGSCVGATCTGVTAGVHTVTGTDGGATGSASLTVNPGPLAHLQLSPDPASIPVGGQQAYTVNGFDAFHNDLGDVTSATTFGITPTGSCSAATCVATSVGSHTVTGTAGAATGRATLTAVAVDHLVLSPASASIAAGGHQAYTAEGFDASNADLGDVSTGTTFGIGPNGSCTGADCTATTAGAHTVTGTDSGATGTAALSVIPAGVDHLALSPASASITAGSHQAYTAEGFDAFNNDIGDVTSATSFSVTAAGSCTGATCTATSAGSHTITGTDGAASDTASLTVTAGTLDHLVLSPASASITAGYHHAYTAEGFDAFGNDLGDVTAATSFGVGPDGSCTVATCTATSAGAHTVTGTDGAATGTAALAVTAGPPAHLVLSPATARIAAGGHQAYTAEGFDAFGNDAGDVTASTTFTITPAGSCTGATCTATSGGSHTVTGTDGAATGTATLDVGVLDHLVLSPVSASITAGGHQAYTAEGFDASNADLGDVTAGTTFSVGPDGSCTGATCTATTAGAHTVTGNDGGKTGTAALAVTAGPLDHLVLAPASASLAAGGHQAYTADGFDAFGNDRGDVTASTSFDIEPNGSCTGATCTATSAGAHTVTGNDGGKTGTASLTVAAGPLDHLVLSPASTSITAGAHQAYAAEGFDQYGNDLGDVTLSTGFGIGPDGSCTGASCTATTAGAHTVTGTDGSATGTAALTVTPGPVVHLTLGPATAIVPVGGHRTYSAEGFDAFGNDVGDLTASTSFAISPSGSCTGKICTATSAGAHTVTGTDGAASGTATLDARAVDHLVLAPASASVTAGGHQAYTSEGFDASNTDLGDLTASTTFAIDPNGSCTAASCTATATGGHTVTGTDGSATGTASLGVTAGAIDHLVLGPASASIAAGGQQAYAAEGYDTFGNDLGDVTASTSFGIGPNGSCTAASCTATTTGAHTVTGTDGAATGTAGLTVTGGPLHHLGVSPASASIAAGGHRAYTAEGFDTFGNDLGDVTSGTAFTVAPDGSCVATACSATTAGAHTVTGTDGSATGTAALTVTAGPLDHLAVSPAMARVAAGGHQAYTAEGFDAFGNDRGDVTAATTFTIVPDGSCTGAACTATIAGTHTVTGTDSAATGTATLTVTAVADTVTVTPHSHALAANGTSHTSVVAVVADSGGNPVSGATVSFTSTPDTTSTRPGGALTLSPASATTDANGVATTTATSSIHSGAVIVTAIEGGAAGTAKEKLVGARFLTSSLSRSPVAADGSSTTTAVATVVDGNGDPVAGDTVTFANSGRPTDPTIAQPSVVTDANGNATDQVTSSTSAGSKSISVTDTASDVPTDQFAVPLILVQTGTNTSFVHAAYQAMLGHDADPGGLAYWVGRLDSGTPRSALALALATSGEYRTNVIGGSIASGVPDFYQLYLHRPADSGGIAYWVGRMAGVGGPRLTFEQVRLQFVGSPEYFNVTHHGDPSQIIDALYNDILGRLPEPSGKAFWLTHFNVTTIASQILFSAEGRQVLVESYYSSILNRGFDQAGLGYWTQAILTGASDENIIADFLSSDEFFQNH
jgi:hypothetical protein